MDHIFKATSINVKLGDRKIKSHRLYNFFMGVPGQLTRQERDQIIKVIQSESRKTIAFLKKVPVSDKKIA